MPTERPSPEQRQFARNLRGQLTDCERLLWRQLRNRGLAGFKFRRQHPCPPYVLDFYCAELRLVVELDGGQHFDKAGLAKDRLRTAYLQHHGLEVLRFSNLDVIRNLEGVLTEILSWIETRTPTLSPMGRGSWIEEAGSLVLMQTAQSNRRE
ncbi:endonuclease domain-containing protein [Stutzerimonas kunmingensis]|uniref:endonuclease domain-containing protein n=1 Tax=Stutzerimonas kunmingensis TaxID=1211807 RepID=UPI0039C97DE1